MHEYHQASVLHHTWHGLRIAPTATLSVQCTTYWHRCHTSTQTAYAMGISHDINLESLDSNDNDSFTADNCLYTCTYIKKNTLIRLYK